MQLSDSAVKQIESMVHSFLPYEVDYVPKTPQSQLIEKLFTAIATPTPSLRQWSGFVMYFMKQVDNQPDKQKDVDAVFDAAYLILLKYKASEGGKT